MSDFIISAIDMGISSTLNMYAKIATFTSCSQLPCLNQVRNEFSFVWNLFQGIIAIVIIMFPKAIALVASITCALAQVTYQNSSGTRLRVDNGTYGPDIEEVHYCEQSEC